MISKKLSLNKVCIILATTILLLSVVMFSVLYILTKEMSVVFCSMAFCLLFLLCVTVFVILIRRKLTLFSEILCCTLDEMMNGKIDISQVAEEENLFYKINHRLVRLYEVMQESKNSVASERADLQELISDISHQVKTPIANLKMVNATLLEQEVPSDKQREFLLASGTQLDKLDFLMQAMIKTSRLETGVISLEKKQPNADSLYIVDIFFPIKAPKNCSLLVFGNTFAGISDADFQVHFPAFNANTDRTVLRRVLNCIIQYVK
jgi:signal transduction histidine kinase